MQKPCKLQFWILPDSVLPPEEAVVLKIPVSITNLANGKSLISH